MSEVAEKRLEAIRAYTEFGAGFKIAMRDLEIRGAGNLLGAQQHGHLADVGYDMYMNLLSEAVEMLKSEENPDRWKAVEERLNIKAVSSGEINEMLLRAGYRNIRLHVRQNEGRLCAIAEKE